MKIKLHRHQTVEFDISLESDELPTDVFEKELSEASEYSGIYFDEAESSITGEIVDKGEVVAVGFN